MCCMHFKNTGCTTLWHQGAGGIVFFAQEETDIIYRFTQMSIKDTKHKIFAEYDPLMATERWGEYSAPGCREILCIRICCVSVLVLKGSHSSRFTRRGTERSEGHWEEHTDTERRVKQTEHSAEEEQTAEPDAGAGQCTDAKRLQQRTPGTVSFSADVNLCFEIVLG